MILAHLPAGYLIGRAFGAKRGWVKAAALAGSVLPDFDLFWFYFVDDRAFHHHRYWVHVPGFWLACGIVVLPLIRMFRPGWLAPAAVFLVSILVHLILDSVGGGIMWLWPFSNHLFSLTTVPATQSHWILSFILHWSFLSEVVIIATALWLFWRAERP